MFCSLPTFWYARKQSQPLSEKLFLHDFSFCQVLVFWLRKPSAGTGVLRPCVNYIFSEQIFGVMRVTICASWMLNLNFFRKVKAALIFVMLFMRSWAAPWMSSSEAIPVGHIIRAWKGHGCLIDSSTSFLIIIIFIVHGAVDVFFWSNSGRPHKKSLERSWLSYL